MRRTTTTYGLMVLAALAVSTTSASGDATEIGGHAGGTATNIIRTGDCPPDSGACSSISIPHDAGLGPVLGAYLRYSTSRHIRLESELMYVVKGYDSGSVVRFHYLEVPLLVRYSSAEDAPGTRVFVHAGLVPAVLLWCHQSGVAFDNDSHASFPYSNACSEGPVVDRTPWRFDLGAALGAGLGWNLDVGVVELEARYTRSLLDIERDDGGKTTNHALYILAGFGRALGM